MLAPIPTLKLRANKIGASSQCYLPRKWTGAELGQKSRHSASAGSPGNAFRGTGPMSHERPRLAGVWAATCTKPSGGNSTGAARLAHRRLVSTYNVLGRQRSRLGSLQLLQVDKLGERAIRPAMLALRLLHECRILLAAMLGSAHDPKSGHLRLFISHAKMDGLPLAHALKHQIEALGWHQITEKNRCPQFPIQHPGTRLHWCQASNSAECAP